MYPSVPRAGAGAGVALEPPGLTRRVLPSALITLAKVPAAIELTTHDYVIGLISVVPRDPRRKHAADFLIADEDNRSLDRSSGRVRPDGQRKAR